MIYCKCWDWRGLVLAKVGAGRKLSVNYEWLGRGCIKSEGFTYQGKI